MDETLARRLDGHRVLLCFGLLGEVMAGLRPIGVDYMASQLDWLQAIGVDAMRMKLPSAAPVARNAEAIAEAILGAPGRVILVAHSKGGLEALSALLMPGVADRCGGFLALQSPFRGSPVADLALGIGALREVSVRLVALAKLGDGEGLHDLTVAVRAPWMERHAAAIEALAARVPVTSLATDLTDQTSLGEHAYVPLSRWMRKMGAGPNDGLVPVASTILPGARHAVLAGGHRALVAGGAGRDPIGLLRRELAALLDRGEQ
jgi:alpha-beta hydrolase superfamily lysophospholipase